MKKFLGVVVVFCASFVYTVDSVNPSAKVDLTEAEDLNNNDNGFVSVFKNYPKIQVTVDTSKLKRVATPENEESSSGSSGSSGSESAEQRTVGVRTDITIEISEESANETNNVDVKVDSRRKNGTEPGRGGKGQDEDDDNASVPVFNGMNGIPTREKPSKPTISNHINGDRPRPGVSLNERPPFMHTPDEHKSGGPYDGWNRYQPVMGVWTTERPYLRRIDYDYRGNPIFVKSYIPYHVGRHDDSSGVGWKPCYCSAYQPWDRAPSNPVLPTPRRKVQDKVDVPHKQHRD
ncbi:uncharacterized protein LOC129729335 [Wyeomyia smithii]|uniref:uncharacterized protein LOC129729335 n=1 Tax=Wyeomyia smithii TaxID=174621 RepID=UPI002467C47C|nr:uncharacterized protein LOC129729335 [Wyeomyia smithii]